jgi:hypothetical protein
MTGRNASCLLTDINLVCPANLCVAACTMNLRYDVPSAFMCGSSPTTPITCSNANRILSSWCSAAGSSSNSPFFTSGTSTPACYTDGIAQCVARCSSPSFFPSLLLPLTGTAATTQYVPILSPNDLIIPRSANSPAGNDASKAIDGDSNTKYRSWDKAGSGFTVIPASGYSIVAGIRITTADDAMERDPMSVTVESANSATSALTFYRRLGPISLTSDSSYMNWWTVGRRATYTFIDSTTSSYNSIPSNIYRVTFNTLRNIPAFPDSMQVAEVQLLGIGCAVNEMSLQTGVTTNCAAGSSVLLGTTCTVTATGCSGGTSVTTYRTCSGVYSNSVSDVNFHTWSLSSPSSTAAPVSSSAGFYIFSLDTSCNLALTYSFLGTSSIVWQTFTNTGVTCESPRLVLTSDGILMVQSGTTNPTSIWQSGPGGRTDGPFTLKIGINIIGAYLLNNANQIVWSTRSASLMWSGSNPTCGGTNGTAPATSLTPSTVLTSAYACGLGCTAGLQPLTPTCVLQSTAISCPANQCLLACALSQRYDVAASYMCRSSFSVTCNNAGSALTSWCPTASTPYLTAGTGSDPACYSSAIAPCIGQCSSIANTPSLAQPVAGAVIVPTQSVPLLSSVDAVFPTSLNYSAGQEAWRVLDGNLATKYANLDKEFSGLTVIPQSGYSILTRLSITLIDTGFEARDPMTVLVESANSVSSSSFYLVGYVNLASNSTYAQSTAPRVTYNFALSSANTVPHNIYRIRFPTLRSTSQASSVQIAELQLFGAGCAVSDLRLPSGTTSNCSSSTFVLPGAACLVTISGCVSGGIFVSTTRICTASHPDIIFNSSDPVITSPYTSSIVDAANGNAALQSSQSNYRLVLQPDCNLVLYSLTAQVWSTDTNALPNCVSPQLSLTSDGSLVIRVNTSTVIWRSGPGGRTDGPFSLRVTSAGLAVLTNNVGQIVWTTSPPLMTWSSINPLCAGTNNAVCALADMGLPSYVSSSCTGTGVGLGTTCTLIANCTGSLSVTSTRTCAYFSYTGGGEAVSSRFSLQSGFLSAARTSVAVLSPYRTNSLNMLIDCNLVLVGNSFWITGTLRVFPLGNCTLELTTDGILRIINSPSGSATSFLWNSSTSGRTDGPFTVRVAEAGFFAILNVNGTTVWSSRSSQTAVWTGANPQCGLATPTTAALTHSLSTCAYADLGTLPRNTTISCMTPASMSRTWFDRSCTLTTLCTSTGQTISTTRTCSNRFNVASVPLTWQPTASKNASLSSPSGQVTLVMQTDCNFVLYRSGTSLWSSNTSGQTGCTLSISITGVPTITTAANAVRWTVGGPRTDGPFALRVYDAGLAVLVNAAGSIVWTTNAASSRTAGFVGSNPLCPCSTTCPAGSFISSPCTAIGDRECSVCPTGQYQLSANSATACLNCTSRCSAGTYLSGTCSPSTNPVCTTCEPSSFQDVGGNQTACKICALCGAGSFISGVCNATRSPTCVSCTAGLTFQDLSGAQSCKACVTQCAPGAFLSSSCSITANGECGFCPAGTHQPNINNASSCLSCVSSCPIGQFLKGVCTSTTTPSCEPCPAGMFQDVAGANTACKSCSTSSSCGPGTFSNFTCTAAALVGGCMACPTGSFQAITAFVSACINCTRSCPAGTALTGSCNAAVGSPVCTPCVDGRYQDTEGTQTACKTCDANCAAGSFLQGTCTTTTPSVCAPCPASTFTDHVNRNSSCAACRSSCAPGQFLSPCNSTSDGRCVSCPMGSFSASSTATACTACVTSCGVDQVFSSACTSTSSPQCSPCPNGFFQDVPGTQTQCKQCTQTCNQGQFVNGTCSALSSPCVACPSGTFQDTAGGQSACKQCTRSCEPGTQFTGSCTTTATPQCAPCADGTFQPNANSTAACTACTSQCGPGTFIAGNCTRTASPVCVGCPTGAFQLATGTQTTCNNCTASCAAGQRLTGTCTATSNRACSACAAGTFNDEAGSASACKACTLSCGINLFVNGSCTPTTTPSCVPCALGTFQDVAGTQTACKVCTASCPVGTFMSGSCIASSPTCVGCGVGSGNFQDTAGAQTACKRCVTSCNRGFALTGSCTPTSSPTCSPCALGTFQSASESNAPACMPCTASCPAGSFLRGECNATDTPVCAPCDSQSFQDVAGPFTACKRCITECGPGQFLNASCSNTASGSCGPCVAGTAKAGVNGALSCSACRAGTVSDFGAAVCSPCPAGSFSPDPLKPCRPCAGGTFSLGGAPMCFGWTSCPAGTFESTAPSAANDRGCLPFHTPPVFSAPVLAVTISSTLALFTPFAQVAASDPDSIPLTYSFAGAEVPSFLAVNATTGEMFASHAVSVLQTEYDFFVQATDNRTFCALSTGRLTGGCFARSRVLVSIAGFVSCPSPLRVYISSMANSTTATWLEPQLNDVARRVQLQETSFAITQSHSPGSSFGIGVAQVCVCVCVCLCVCLCVCVCVSMMSACLVVCVSVCL